MGVLIGIKRLWSYREERLKKGMKYDAKKWAYASLESLLSIFIFQI